jgi:hypothetical protein
MANSIDYPVIYKKKMDLIFKASAVTGILEASPDAIDFKNTLEKEVKIQKMTLQGLGTYSRTDGYTGGDITEEWETHTFSEDRSRRFGLDAMDSKEAYIKIAKVGAQFTREHVAPEIDAYRFGKICSLCSVDQTADLTVDNVIAAIDTAIETLDDAEVPQEGRVMFVSNEVSRLMKNSGDFFNTRITHDNMNAKINRKISHLDDIPLIRVPKARFYSAFDFYDGETAGQEAGGFTPSSGATQLNFIIAPIKILLGIIKYIDPKIVDKKYNTDADKWIYALRVYHDLFILENKLPGVYIHKKAT